MKLINKLLTDVSEKETYKQQFVVNELKNILFVDPILSSHDFYNMILPAVALNSFDKANVAFTNINKFVSDSDKNIVQLSDAEILWADVMVFPFTLIKYEADGFPLFDEIRKIKPEMKIIFLVETNFWNNLFSSKLYKHAGKQKLFSEFVLENILFNIKTSDKVLVHNENLKNDLQLLLIKNKIEKPICVNLFGNNFETLIEGFTQPKKYKYRDPFQIKIVVELLDESDFDSLLKNVIEKSSDKCLFFVNTKVKHTKIVNLKQATITHWYKELYLHNYDYQLIYGNCNVLNKSRFIFGKILDASFFAVHTLINSKSLFDYLPKEAKKMCSFKNTKQTIELFDEVDEKAFRERLLLVSKSKEASSQEFEFSNEESSQIIEKYIENYLNF